MPIYKYKCLVPNCKKKVEVMHSMDECKNPSADTQVETSCNEHTCPNATILTADSIIEPEYGKPFVREITAPHIGGMIGGSSVSESALLAKKQKGLKKRSRDHFKREVMNDPDGLVQNDKDAKRHFEGKYKKK